MIEGCDIEHQESGIYSLVCLPNTLDIWYIYISCGQWYKHYREKFLYYVPHKLVVELNRAFLSPLREPIIDSFVCLCTSRCSRHCGHSLTLGLHWKVSKPQESRHLSLLDSSVTFARLTVVQILLHRAQYPV